MSEKAASASTQCNVVWWSCISECWSAHTAALCLLLAIGKVCYAQHGRGWSAYFPLSGYRVWKWVFHNNIKSVTHGQCDARRTVVFPVMGHYHPLTSTTSYCWMTEAHVWMICPELLCEMWSLYVKIATSWSQVNRSNHCAAVSHFSVVDFSDKMHLRVKAMGLVRCVSFSPQMNDWMQIVH